MREFFDVGVARRARQARVNAGCVFGRIDVNRSPRFGFQVGLLMASQALVIRRLGRFRLSTRPGCDEQERSDDKARRPAPSKFRRSTRHFAAPPKRAIAKSLTSCPDRSISSDSARRRRAVCGTCCSRSESFARRRWCDCHRGTGSTRASPDGPDCSDRCPT